MSADHEGLSFANPRINVRISKRAKYACLKVTPLGRVELVVPKHFNPHQIPDFIAQHQQWLEDILLRLRRQRGAYLDQMSPPVIELAAVDETWQVSYGVAKHPKVTERYDAQGNAQLWVMTAQETQQATALCKWLSQKAKYHLKMALDDICRETGLSYRKLTVRAQKTRWGSCSQQKNISLNRSLMFLPAPLLRYLLIHELCHTVHLNHSRAYWALVARWVPDYKKCERELNHYTSQIPLWAHP
ncbi:M48 family metallopeptidase [Kaarinaea lacus]